VSGSPPRSRVVKLGQTIRHSFMPCLLQTTHTRQIVSAAGNQRSTSIAVRIYQCHYMTLYFKLFLILAPNLPHCVPPAVRHWLNSEASSVVVVVVVVVVNCATMAGFDTGSIPSSKACLHLSWIGRLIDRKYAN
jgi:hypothetical protein